MQRRRLILPAFSLVLAGAICAEPAAAQDVSYETVTRVELPGTAGTVLRAAARIGGAGLERTETVHISGQRMRTDENGSSTIMDLRSGRIIFLNHDERTWFEVSLGATLEAAQAAAQAARDDARAAADDADTDMRVDFRMDVERAGERQQVSGFNAERFFVTLQARGEVAVEEEEQARTGGLVVLTDVWTSTSAPMARMHQAFGEAPRASQFTEAASGLMETLAEMFADDPDIGVGFQRAVEEARGLEGAPLRTTTRFVILGDGAEFDRALALGEGGGPGLVQQAARGALGRLARRAAGARDRPQQQQEPADEPEDVAQRTVLTIISEVRNVSTGRVDPALFAPPADYRRINDG